jgi:hypothetical protein
MSLMLNRDARSLARVAEKSSAQRMRGDDARNISLHTHTRRNTQWRMWQRAVVAISTSAITDLVAGDRVGHDSAAV